MVEDTFEILLITHGALCKGYLDTLKLILDITDEDLDILSFDLGEEIDNFTLKVSKKINERYKDKNLVVLLDLPGGSPANVSLPFISSSCKLVAGFNLPFLLELMIMKKSGSKWESLNVDKVLQSAKDNMVFYNKLLKMEENI